MNWVREVRVQMKAVVVCEWWLLPVKQRNKRKSVKKIMETVKVEDAATGTDTNEYDYMSDCSELSSTLSVRGITFTLQVCTKVFSCRHEAGRALIWGNISPTSSL